MGTAVLWFPAQTEHGLEEERYAAAGERRGGGGQRRKENLRRKSVAVIRSASNGFHGGLFKNNKFKKNKKLFCAFLCLSLCLKKLGDFRMSEGHGYLLVEVNLVNAILGPTLHLESGPMFNPNQTFLLVQKLNLAPRALH